LVLFLETLFKALVEQLVDRLTTNAALGVAETASRMTLGLVLK
jgi:hypothetical protein